MAPAARLLFPVKSGTKLAKSPARIWSADTASPDTKKTQDLGKDCVMSNTPLSLRTAKVRARRLRASIAAKDREMSHGQALEAVARHHGPRLGNTVEARLADPPEPEVFYSDDATAAPIRGTPSKGDVQGRIARHERALPGHAAL